MGIQSLRKFSFVQFPAMKNIGVLTSFLFFLFLTIGVKSVVSVCPPGCKCDDENLHVDCNDANIDSVPYTLNPVVKKLHLRNNKIRNIDTGFSYYQELTYIDLSHNHLLKISQGSFSTQSKLSEIHLNNNKISELSNLTFGPYPGMTNYKELSDLTHVNLRENLLETLQAGVFNFTRNLQDLDLGQNSLRELNASALLGLEKLIILKLDHNELRIVPGVFSNNSNYMNGQFGTTVRLIHLVELYMGMNPIDRIGNDAFTALTNLRILDLRGCHLNAIEPNAFRGLGLLKKLILSDNNLKVIPTTSFQPLKNLDILKIGRNPILTLGAYSFSPLKKVKTIEMSGAPELASVDSAAFISNLDLELLEISNAKKLSSLPSNLLKGISSLKTLILKENALQSLPEDLVSWQSLRALRLEGNPFRCSCDLLWLRDLLELQKFKNSSFLVLCNEPKEFHEKRITSLTDKDLDCYLNGPIQKTILGISIGVAVIFLAVFFFVMYRYHDNIKSACKRKCFRRRRHTGLRKNHRGSSSSAVKAAELDTSTKTSFLSQSTYPYSDEEYALRTSLMSTSPPQPSGPPYSTHSLSINPHHSLHRGFHPATHNNYNVHSLSHPHHHYNPNNHIQQPHYIPHPQHHTNGALPQYTEPEYETPMNLGVGGLNLNYPHHYASSSNGMIQQPQVHYNSHHQMIKPIPITEL